MVVAFFDIWLDFCVLTALRFWGGLVGVGLHHVGAAGR